MLSDTKQADLEPLILCIPAFEQSLDRLACIEGIPARATTFVFVEQKLGSPRNL